MAATDRTERERKKERKKKMDRKRDRKRQKEHSGEYFVLQTVINYSQYGNLFINHVDQPK